MFSRTLAHLLESGFPLLPGIAILAEQRVISPAQAERIRQKLNEGASFSQTLQGEGVPPLFLSFVSAAEEHGDYGQGLRQCEAYYHELARRRREIGQAVIYPVIVFVLVILSFLFLITAVIPRFSVLYETMGLELPPFTVGMIRLYAWLNESLAGAVWSVSLLVVAGLGLRMLPPERRAPWVERIIRLPMVRRMYRYRFTHYFSIQLGLLLRAGVPLLRALDIMRELTPWWSLKASIDRIRSCLLSGESLHDALKHGGATLLLPTLSQWVALGEETGRLDHALLSMAKGTELLMHEQIRRFTRSLEPVLIFCIGLMIAVTVMALFLPMLQLVKAI
ncbi:type II secretion system F family protein [Polycladomyces sp. WAk]|uniref:Type II secretion system F family protein n=1 Tax=Polycladomyces zharkentensis TaxID=2807616 RepID=A0ABS2WG34_9BACL|nr:type II secretion system F family protein [Polycladomyces sp. WAk]